MLMQIPRHLGMWDWQWLLVASGDIKEGEAETLRIWGLIGSEYKL